MVNQCNICEKYFASSQYKDLHMRTIHGTERHPCPLCIYQAKQTTHLRRHIKLMHETDRQGKERNGKFIDRTHFKHECRVCEKKFETKQNLKQHFKGRHTAKKYHCPRCVRCFPWQASLDRHITKTHKNSGLTYEIKCLEGKNVWEIMKEHCMPECILPEDDIINLYSYRHYIQNKIGAYTD